MARRSVILAFGLAAALAGCKNSVFDPTPAAPQTAEAFCASIPSTGFGNFFYCATAQSNLQAALPNGWLGYCEPADTNSIGLVGYSATTYNGGAFPVTDFSTSQAECASVNTPGNTQCGTIIRCTRQ